MLRSIARAVPRSRVAAVATPIRGLAQPAASHIDEAGAFANVGSSNYTPINDEPSVTTLDNGVRVASVPSESPVARVAVYINAGSRFENADNSGVAAFIARNAFTATSTRSEFRVIRDLAHIGAETSAVAGRSSIVYGAKSQVGAVRDALMLIADSINNSRYMKLEVANAANVFEEEVKERSFDGNAILEEAIHAAAYTNNTLGLPLYPPISQLPKLDRYAILSYVDALYTPNRFVIVGSGVGHEQLVKISKELFTSSDLPARKGTSDVAAKYTGGDVRVHRRGLPGNAYVALGFNGAAVGSADVAAQRVLQTVLEGSRLPSGAAVAGGIFGNGSADHLVRRFGNGATRSRLSTVSKGSAYLSTLGSSYVDGGVFALGFAAQPTDAESFAGKLAATFKGVASGVTAEEIAQAKLLTKSAIFSASSCRGEQLSQLAEQVIAGAPKSRSAQAAAVDAVTAEDVQRVARQLLSSQLSVAGYGDLSYLPRYDQLATLFK